MQLQEYILTALATKTVVFVTHQVEFLPAADLILVLSTNYFLAVFSVDFLPSFMSILAQLVDRGASVALSQCLISVSWSLMSILTTNNW